MKASEHTTFIVKVMEQQNDSWQGSVTNAENNETQYFRSALELLHMMEEVVQSKKACEK